jgi:hypothetical protein
MRAGCSFGAGIGETLVATLVVVEDEVAGRQRGVGRKIGDHLRVDRTVDTAGAIEALATTFGGARAW